MNRSILVLLIAFLSTNLILAQDAPSAASLYNDGFAMLKEKKYEEGLPLIEQALEKAKADQDQKIIDLAKKNGAVAAYNVGNNLRKANKLDEALTYFKKGHEWNPDKSNNISGIAMIYEAQGDKVNAMLTYLESAEIAKAASKKERALKFSKKAQNIVGKFYTGEEYDKAIEAGKAYLEKDNMSDDVHYYLSRSYSEKSQFDEALSHAEEAIKIAGDKTEDKYYVAKGLALEGKDDKIAAIEAYSMVTGEKYKALAESKIANLKS